jgi:hypothetical protein
VCAIESARWAHPRCYGASVGFSRKGLPTIRLMCDTYVAVVLADKQVVHQQLNKLRGVSLLGILQKRGELGRVIERASLLEVYIICTMMICRRVAS